MPFPSYGPNFCHIGDDSKLAQIFFSFTTISQTEVWFSPWILASSAHNFVAFTFFT